MHIEKGEKSKHFSYPDYFTYPVSRHGPLGQRCPDNRGCTVVGIFHGENFCGLLDHTACYPLSLQTITEKAYVDGHKQQNLHKFSPLKLSRYAVYMTYDSIDQYMLLFTISFPLLLLLFTSYVQHVPCVDPVSPPV